MNFFAPWWKWNTCSWIKIARCKRICPSTLVNFAYCHQSWVYKTPLVYYSFVVVLTFPLNTHRITPCLFISFCDKLVVRLINMWCIPFFFEGQNSMIQAMFHGIKWCHVGSKTVENLYHVPCRICFNIGIYLTQSSTYVRSHFFPRFCCHECVGCHDDCWAFSTSKFHQKIVRVIISFSLSLQKKNRWPSLTRHTPCSVHCYAGARIVRSFLVLPFFGTSYHLHISIRTCHEACLVSTANEIMSYFFKWLPW